MPDYPPIDGLQQAVERKILPRKAGDVSPVVMRAAEGLRHLYPADMYSTDVKELPLTHPHAFSNIIGETPIDTASIGIPNKENPEAIQINPAVGMGFAQVEAASTLAHELEHVRQGRTMDPMERINQFSMDYAQRPDEVAARKAANRDVMKMPLSPKNGPILFDNETIMNALGGLFLSPK